MKFDRAYYQIAC